SVGKRLRVRSRISNWSIHFRNLRASAADRGTTPFASTYTGLVWAFRAEVAVSPVPGPSARNASQPPRSTVTSRSSVAVKLSPATFAVAITSPLWTNSAFDSGDLERAVAFTETLGLSPTFSTAPGPMPFAVKVSMGPLVTNDLPAFRPSTQPL